MNTYQHELITKLITELTDKPSSNLHAAQMLAAELKGAMQAQDTPNEPTPDADGWVKNTGTMPECNNISALRFADGTEKKDLVGDDTVTRLWSWRLKNHITHYRPA